MKMDYRPSWWARTGRALSHLLPLCVGLGVIVGGAAAVRLATFLFAIDWPLPTWVAGPLAALDLFVACILTGIAFDNRRRR